jgi:hypothetical protein
MNFLQIKEQTHIYRATFCQKGKAFRRNFGAAEEASIYVGFEGNQVLSLFSLILQN